MKVKKIANGIKHFGINCRILTQSTSEGEREEGEAEAGGEERVGRGRGGGLGRGRKDRKRNVKGSNTFFISKVCFLRIPKL